MRMTCERIKAYQIRRGAKFGKKDMAAAEKLTECSQCNLSAAHLTLSTYLTFINVTLQ